MANVSRFFYPLFMVLPLGRLKFVLFIAPALIAFSSFSPCAAEPAGRPRPKVGLVLSGGGALGFAHIGVIKILEQNRVPVDLITGTSMGAIVGAAYASGATIEEMELMTTSTDWQALFSETIPRRELPLRFKSGRNRELFGDVKIGIGEKGIIMPTGFIQGQEVFPVFQNLYRKVPSPVDFDELPLPFRAVTADIENGQAVVPKEGDLPTVVRASMSVPAFFSPVELNGRLLVDGGIVDNFPIGLARRMGAEVVIAVDLASNFKKKDELTDPVAIAGQILSLLLEQNSAAQKKLLHEGDVYILADTSNYSPTSFENGKEILAIGEAAADKLADRLKVLSVAPEVYDDWQKKRTTPMVHEGGIISEVRIVNNSPISNDSIRSALGIKAGEKFERTVIEDGIEHVYSMGYFSTVEYNAEQSGPDKIVTITVKKKNWLDRYLRVGASIEDNFKSAGTYRLGADYRNTTLDKAGRYFDLQGEIGRTPYARAEWFEPLTEDSPWFAAPAVFIGKTPIFVRESDDDLIAEYSNSRGWAELRAGRQFGRSTEYSVGMREGKGRVSRYIGSSSLPSSDYDIGEGFFSLEHDSLDTRDFPTEGYLTRFLFIGSGESLAASDNYNEFTGAATLPLTAGDDTLLLVSGFSQTIPRRPVDRSFSFGGFLNVSGFETASLTASDYEFARLIFYRRFSEYRLPISNLSFFLGASAEYASLRSDIQALPDRSPLWSGSVFMGIDTPLIPTYLGFGLAEEGNATAYLMLGRIGQREDY